jgi:hypothetical protein
VRLIVGVYVDDLIITGGDAVTVAKFKVQMKNIFKMSDLGLLSYYLGLEVSQGKQGITLRQSGYASKVLEKAGLAGCNASAMLMEPKLKLLKDDTTPSVDATEYCSLIDSLRYLSTCAILGRTWVIRWDTLAVSWRHHAKNTLRLSRGSFGMWQAHWIGACTIAQDRKMEAHRSCWATLIATLLEM